MNSGIEMDAPFTRDELMQLAQEILALECSANSMVHAEKMIEVKDDEYSRSFFEAATRIRELLSTGFSLTTAVEAVAGCVPSVEDIEFKLHWWECDIVNVTKKELYETAAMIEEFEVPSPDRALAIRINTKKASKEERKLFALRYVDYKSRISRFDLHLWDFCSDTTRTKMELAALKLCINKACKTGDSYDVERPVMPPWKDNEYWEADLDEWGYGDDFSPTYAPLPSSEIVPISQNTAAAQHALDDVVENALIEEEEYEVTDLNPDVFEDEELYAAKDAEIDKLLADAVHLPKQLSVEHQSSKAVGIIPQITSNYTVLTAKEKEQLAADSAMLTDAMSYSSFKKELQACEEAMKKDPDGKLLQGAVNRLLESQERIERLELAANNKSEARNDTVIKSGSNVASTSAGLPPEFSLPDDIDVNAYSQLIAPHQLEEEWPALTKEKSTGKIQQQAPVSTAKTQPANNVWVEKNKNRKSFMNAGIGGKLPHVKPTANAFYVDVNMAPSIQDIWGYSLLGQYVGHNPGHYLLNAMIKSWGVRAKYKIEEGWYIFSFETEQDQQKVLIGGPYLIHGRPMLLKNIPDKFAFNRKDLALVPLWVRVYGLASRFWTPEILGGIASYVGCPMYMDPVTDGRKRNAYARILVEINLAAQIKKTVPIEFSDGDTTEVYFLVENQPKFCTDCCSYGHEFSGCQFLSKKPSTAAKDTTDRTVHKPPGNAHVAHKNSQQTPPTPAENALPGTDINSSTASLRNGQNRGEDPHLQICMGTTQGNGITQQHHTGSAGNEDEGEVHGHISHKQDQLTSAQTVVHSELSLANQFAALNDATDMTNLNGNQDDEARTTRIIEENNTQLATDLTRDENVKGKCNGKGTEQQVAFQQMDAASPTNKNSQSNTRNIAKTSSHNRKKAHKN